MDVNTTDTLRKQNNCIIDIQNDRNQILKDIGTRLTYIIGLLGLIVGIILTS